MSLLAALGVTAGACGTTVMFEGGGSGGSGAAATSATGNGSTGPSTGSGTGVVCEGAVPVNDELGNWTGFDRCPDGTIHRVEAIACDQTVTAPKCDGTEAWAECASDEQCGPGGSCVKLTSPQWGEDPYYCGCVHPCETDADCGAGLACICRGAVDGALWASCAPAGCATGESCESGECGLSSYDTGCDIWTQLGCRTAADTCRIDADCASNPSAQLCEVNLDHWSCVSDGCVEGRPYLVQGRALTAAPRARADWVTELDVDALAIAPEVRAALAARWRESAAFEHASIASFARFTLELLAFGAPSDLVAEAQRAALDEVHHARIAYALASAFAGEPCGPGPLELGPVTIAQSRAELVRGLVHEACVNETLAVAEARAIAEGVSDPALAGILRGIADDEERHAALAWRTLAWLLADDETLRQVAASAFAEATQRWSGTPRAPVVAPNVGLLEASELAAIRRAALREVIAPCAEAVLS